MNTKVNKILKFIMQILMKAGLLMEVFSESRNDSFGNIRFGNGILGLCRFK